MDHQWDEQAPTVSLHHAQAKLLLHAPLMRRCVPMARVSAERAPTVSLHHAQVPLLRAPKKQRSAQMDQQWDEQAPTVSLQRAQIRQPPDLP